MKLLSARILTAAVFLTISALVPAVSMSQQAMTEISLGGSSPVSAESSSGTVLTIDGTTVGTAAGELTNPGPEGVAFDGTNVWIATQFNNSVTKVRASDGAILGRF